MPSPFDNLEPYSNAGPGLSQFWSDCPFNAYLVGEPSSDTRGRKGYAILEQWDYPTKYTWTLSQAGGVGTLTARASLANPFLTAGHTDAGDGVNWQITTPATMWTPTALKTIWFEVCTCPSVTGAQYAFGLAVADTTLINGGLNTASEWIGWYATAAQATATPTALLFNTINGSAADTPVAQAQPYIVGWNKYGFKVFGETGALKVNAYFNGIFQGQWVTQANIPVADPLTPSIVCQSNGVANPVLTLGWLAVAQMWDDSYATPV